MGAKKSRPLVTLRRILLMPICSEEYFTGVVIRGCPARSPEDDARIKYDGINIDGARPGERVQLETRRKRPAERTAERERRNGDPVRERWKGVEMKPREERVHLGVVTHVAMELSAMK